MRSRRLTAPLPLTTALLLATLAPATAQAAPTIPLTTISGPTTTSVILEADINPQGTALEYHFEHGASDCASGPCTSIPVPNAKLGPGSAPIRVKAQIKGLTPGTPYHFRVVAKNVLAEKAESPDQTFATYAEPPVFGPCPNDALRIDNPSFPPPQRSSANLPDCRVYEQVSPIEKNGGDITGYVPLVKASLSGDRVTFSSSSGIPGADGAQEIPTYLATRGASGWSTQGTFPPATEGQNGFVLGWTPDFEWVFSEATKLGDPIESTFLARPSSGGSLETIVDHTGEFSASLAGTSEDASEVLFESRKALLQGAVQGKSNLYLWQRQTEALFLVGVLNDEATPPQGAIAGSYDWVAGATAETLSRGGSARGYYTQDQHVISGDGSKLYFTEAGTGQLYLRKNPTQEQSPLDGKGKCTDPAKACTINVSASRKTNGAGTDGKDAAGTQPAAFLGASADGSVTYFTSSEKLTNDANTGEEPTNPPAIVSAELDGDPVDFKFLPAKTEELTVDDGFIYWITGKESIARCAINCTTPEEDFIPATETDNPKGLALDESFIYWTNSGVEVGGDDSIGRAEIDGDNPDSDFIPAEVEESPGVFETLVSQPRGIDVDGTHVYWVNADTDPFFELGYVARAEIDGDPASVEPKLIQFANGDVAVNATHIYYSGKQKASFSGGIRRTKIEGGGGSEGCTDFPAPQGTAKAPSIALDASHLYWSNYDASAIGRTDLECQNDEHQWIKDAGNPQGLGIDATNLYWTANQSIQTNPGNDLYRYEADTDTLIDLLPDPIDKDGIDVQGILGASQDGSVVYLAANGVPGGVANSPNARGESASPGSCKGELGETISPSGICNLYLWQEGAGLSFIARLDVGGSFGSDAIDWVGTPLSVFPTHHFQRSALVAPDGQTLLFRSQRQLTAYENEGVPQLYRYQAGKAGATCVTCNPTGMPSRDIGEPFGVIAPFGSILPSGVTPPPRTSPYLSHNLSDDGNRVFFQSVEPLVVNDVNSKNAKGEDTCVPFGAFNQNKLHPSCMDVYEWEAQGTGSCESDLAGGGCLYLLSSGQGKEPALIGSSSASGGDVFFFTRERLVGQDDDELVDVYTARENGGLASQNQPPPPPPCEGEGCRGQGSSAPPQAGAATPVFQGPGDPPVSRKCPKGKRRVKARGGVRCVRKQRKNRSRARLGTDNRGGRA